MTKMPAPLFSIVTITHNNQAGLAFTFASLSTQTYSDFEWIVVDGASTDGTIDFLRNQTHRIAHKTIISEPDGGIYEAMNKGIKAACGAYILFLNAGDRLANTEVLATIAPPLQKQPDFLYGDALEGEPLTLKPARRYRDLPWGMFTHHQAMIYARAVLLNTGLRYSTIYEIAGDYDFTARFLKASKSIIYLPKPICIFESGGVSQRNPALGRREQYEIREALGLCPPVQNVMITLIQATAWWFKKQAPGFYRFVKGLILKDRASAKKVKKS